MIPTSRRALACPPQCDKTFDSWPPLLNHVGQCKGIHRAGHPSVRDDRLHIRAGLKDGHSLEDLEPGLVKKIGHKHAHQGLVLDEDTHARLGIWHKGEFYLQVHTTATGGG